MSRTYIAAELRRRVAQRSNNTCEYCLIPLIFGFATPYQIDHIISEKHDGPTSFENLAYSCPACNLNKGSDVAAYLMEEDIVVRLYHPRKDRWASHFSLEDGVLQALTLVAAATIKLLNLNHPDYCEVRKILIDGEVDLIPS